MNELNPLAKYPCPLSSFIFQRIIAFDFSKPYFLLHHLYESEVVDIVRILNHS